jgi:hypothetical protein
MVVARKSRKQTNQRTLELVSEVKPVPGSLTVWVWVDIK